MGTPVIQAPALEMLKLLDALAEFSAPGTGVTRLLYTSEWRRAQLFIQERMIGFGLDVTVDQVGNVYGRLQGANPEDKVILTGSHIDTVVNGGKYDGAYGIAAAVTAIHYLQQTFGHPLRTLEVVSFCEEEGSRFPLTFWGSGHVTGMYGGGEMATCVDAEGVSLLTAMTDSGFGVGSIEDDRDEHDRGTVGNRVGSRAMGLEAGARRSDIGAFVELHIEQGIILEKTETEIGIVQAIVGQRRYRIKVSGVANHAGTTPMMMRLDALAGLAEMLILLESLALEVGENLVATCGRLEVFPNTPNVIPGEVVFTLDIRHSEEEELGGFCDRTLSGFRETAIKRGLEIVVSLSLSTPPAPMDMKLCAMLESTCQKRGKSYRMMVSGAGHDAQLFAPQCATTMIFVPSQAGISHSPEEYSTPEALAAGLDVLTTMLYELAYV
ncbi:allantoate amidohydrolase [Paenibacillus crassostreae]|uniref:Allantoate amidohydrolase n=2 Tax=Paenibacillus crassostreae TaxID=1763538 RepID=A0A167BHF6_9BACL|nr:allantoate amidohydrolase [Paenibacillus crassostreae]OAB72072.1 allantoate amidohydrolase [Paenibacillus crassostreae]